VIDDRTTDGLADLLRGAAILSHAGNRTAAIAALGSAIAIAPDDLTAHRRLAAAYAVAGDADRARSEYDRFIARLEARGYPEAAAVEHAYAGMLFAARPSVTAAPAHRGLHRGSIVRAPAHRCRAGRDRRDRGRDARCGCRDLRERRSALVRDLDEVDRHPRTVHRHRSDHQTYATADVMLAGPREGKRPKSRQLAAIDRFGRADERAAASGLHLDEHMAAVIACNEVELAVARPRVARDNPDAAGLELTRDRRFAEVTEEPALIGHDPDVGPGLPRRRGLPDAATVGTEIRAFTAADIEISRTPRRSRRSVAPGSASP